MRKVIDVKWFNCLNFRGTIGIVEVDDDGEVSSYIGIGKGDDEKEDVETILQYGERIEGSFVFVRDEKAWDGVPDRPATIKKKTKV